MLIFVGVSLRAMAVPGAHGPESPASRLLPLAARSRERAGQRPRPTAELNLLPVAAARRRSPTSSSRRFHRGRFLPCRACPISRRRARRRRSARCLSSPAKSGRSRRRRTFCRTRFSRVSRRASRALRKRAAVEQELAGLRAFYAFHLRGLGDVDDEFLERGVEHEIGLVGAVAGGGFQIGGMKRFAGEVAR